MHKTVVINAVGLTPSLVGVHTPRLQDFLSRGGLATIEPVIPSVTCSVQSTYLTGAWPDAHGVVGNGWYFKDECEIKFWRQSNRLVHGPKVWETQRQRTPEGFTCASLFWWFNMYSSADISVTPRPMYPADGRKIPDIHTSPAPLRGELQSALGRFPLFNFWGPGADIAATRWIVDAALYVERKSDPTLTLVYLPHLDYDLQRFGPSSPESDNACRELDAEVGRLLDRYTETGHRVIILSEYGIAPVSRPIHINRELRRNNLIVTREELGRELLDAGASDAFAVVDHQIAHVYVNNPARREDARRILHDTPGVAKIYEGDERADIHLNHARAGEFVVLAEPGAWFTYYYWLNDTRAPDFARTVDIHRKPGYDPVELFVDPSLRLPKLKIASKLARKKIGFRTLMDVISLDASIVKGSHGIPPATPEVGPLLMTSAPHLLPTNRLAPTAVHDLIHSHLDA